MIAERIGRMLGIRIAAALGCSAGLCLACDPPAAAPPAEATAQTKAEVADDPPPTRDAAAPAAKTKAHTCNICGETSKFGDNLGRPEAECPRCKSRERHRLLLHYFEHELKLFHEKLDFLHVSPMDCEKIVFRHQPNWHYVTSDFEGSEDLRIDLTAIDQPDDAWDVVLAYHIFEHIIEDQKAMREVFRILRPGGRAFVQVPIEPAQEEIYEDASIVDPQARKEHFGQSDHVRKYSAQGFRQRLETAGFAVEAVDYLARLDRVVVARHQLSGAFDPPLDERIWVATKPARPDRPPR